MRLEDYAIRIEPLSSDEGGGFLVTVPDLPGCIADGETVEQAIAEAHDAFKAWAMAEREDKGVLLAPKARGLHGHGDRRRSGRRQHETASSQGALRCVGAKGGDGRRRQVEPIAPRLAEQSTTRGATHSP